MKNIDLNFYPGWTRKADKSVILTETSVKSPSDIDLYIKIDGKRFTLRAGCEIFTETI